MAEGVAPANGIEIWWQDFGDPADPAVLLVMGATVPATGWQPEFYEPIVAAGHRVIRFDNRDVGRSTWIDYEQSPYTVEDMADDAIGLLDALSVDRAHVIGASLGGMIGQAVAIRFPERVRSLTSIMSTPSSPEDPDLSDMSDEIRAAGERLQSGQVDPQNMLVEMWRLLSGSRFKFDEAAFRARIADLAVGFNPTCSHGDAAGASPSRRERLRQLRVPTLVIHGDEDPIIPLDHGIATADAVPDAKLIVMKGVGHELPPGVLAEIHPAILEHLAESS